jgi:hypothetical protein
VDTASNFSGTIDKEDESSTNWDITPYPGLFQSAQYFAASHADRAQASVFVWFHFQPKFFVIVAKGKILDGKSFDFK